MWHIAKDGKSRNNDSHPNQKKKHPTSCLSSVRESHTGPIDERKPVIASTAAFDDDLDIIKNSKLPTENMAVENLKTNTGTLILISACLVDNQPMDILQSFTEITARREARFGKVQERHVDNEPEKRKNRVNLPRTTAELEKLKKEKTLPYCHHHIVIVVGYLEHKKQNEDKLHKAQIYLWVNSRKQKYTRFSPNMETGCRTKKCSQQKITVRKKNRVIEYCTNIDNVTKRNKIRLEISM